MTIPKPVTDYLTIIEGGTLEITVTDSTMIVRKKPQVQNAGGTQVTINSAFINGEVTGVFTTVGIAQSSQTIITFNNPANATFTMNPGTSYTVKLVTAVGTSIVSSAITYSP